MNRKISAYLSLIICILSALLLIALLITFPSFFRWFTEKSLNDQYVKHVSIAFYTASPFAAVSLFLLIKLLLNVIHDKVFIRSNVLYLKIISYCCYAVMIISAIFIFYYKSMCYVAFTMGVVGTLLRVVKNVMQSAVELREENDLTI